MVMFGVVYISSFVCVLGCDSWFLVWLGLELNMLSFIFIIFNRSLMEVESSLKYFFIQSIGSGLLLGIFYLEYSYMEEVFLVVLMYKVGGGPFYFWFPSLCEGISWISCFLLMTLQKIIPFVLMSLCLSAAIWLMIYISLIVGCLGSFNEIKIKKLLSFSSIHHIGWMLVCMYLGFVVWVIYLISYFIMLQGIFYILHKNSIISIEDVSRSSESLFFCFNMLNMGGMPPMFGFFLKSWVFFLIDQSMFFITIGMVILSVVMFYVYLRMIYSIIMGELVLFSGSQIISYYKDWGWSFMFLMGLIMGPFVIFLFL